MLGTTVPPAAQQPLPVGAEFQVNTYTTGYQWRPALAVHADGAFVVVWESLGQDGSNSGVFGRRYDASGHPLGPEFPVNIYTTDAQRFPHLAMDQAGRFVVVWQSVGQDGQYGGIFGRLFDAASVPLTSEFQVNSVTAFNQTHPVVSVDTAGNFVVAYESPDGDFPAFEGVYARLFDSGANPVGPALQVNTFTTDYQRYPDVAADAAGNFSVIWHSRGAQDGSFYSVQGRRYDAAGNPLSPEFLVNTTTLENQWFPAVAVGPTGEAVVTWSDVSTNGFGGHDGSGSGVYAQRYHPGGATDGGEFQVHSYTTFGQYAESIAKDSGGSFVVTWSGNGAGDSDGVFAQRLGVNGNQVGSEFRLNSDTTLRLRGSFVQTDDSGNFIVTWQSGPVFGHPEVMVRRFLADPVFVDDFQSGGLASWSPQSLTDAGDLSVAPAAGLKSTSLGLQAVIDDTSSLYALDDTPAGENRYAARFWIDPNDVDPGIGLNHFRIRVFLGMQGSPLRRIITIVLRRLASGQFGLMGRVRTDTGGRADTGFFDVTDAPHLVQFDWRRATGPGANDGSFKLWIDSVLVASLMNLDNDETSIDAGRLGAMSLKLGALGTLYEDEFESWRPIP